MNTEFYGILSNETNIKMNFNSIFNSDFFTLDQNTDRQDFTLDRDSNLNSQGSEDFDSPDFDSPDFDSPEFLSQDSIYSSNDDETEVRSLQTCFRPTNSKCSTCFQTLANRGPDSRFVIEAIFKPLVPKLSQSLIMITQNRAHAKHES